MQSFVGELAHAPGRDPKDMLIELIGPPRIFDPRKSPEAAATPITATRSRPTRSTPARLRRVVELVAEQAEWGRKLPPGHGLGIAVHRSFLSYVATVVEVAVDGKGKLTVPRVDTAIDCGFAANPERIRSQIEGAAVMGLSLAKYGEISFKNGRAQQNNFDGFQVARIDESPAITHVYIVPAASTCRRAASASRDCRPSRRPCATRSSPPPASASAACRSAISSRAEARRWAGLLARPDCRCARPLQS